MPEFELRSDIPGDLDALASAIDLNDWDEDLEEEDKDFARESAVQVLEKFHVFRKE